MIGPSGCGKTTAIREVFNKFPEGILYTEINGPSSFIMNLATALNKKVFPCGIFDVLLGYINVKCVQHELPESQIQALDHIVKLLEKVAKQYHAEYGVSHGQRNV